MKLRTRHMNRALSTVLTTIIILVASVVLATGVVLYGTSLFQTSTQQEAISVTGVKLWTNANEPTGYTWGAFTVRNTGDKILSVNKISVRGVDMPFTQWYPDTDVTSNDLQQAMNFTTWSDINGLLTNSTAANCTPGTKMEITLAVGVDFCADAASGPVGLDPGAGAIIYFSLTNGTISSLDAGVSTAVGVFAGKSGAPISVTVSSKT
ncbi:MAG: hypothetical protein IH813_04790 [Thaumarchaeota archaeon]|nr:hypothetical protein [Nitrososphaerota archaeon]